MVRAEALVAISEEIAAEMELAGATRRRITQIPNGVDLEWVRSHLPETAPRQAAISLLATCSATADASQQARPLSAPSLSPSAPVRILSLGRNHAKKGFGDLLRAHAGLRRRGSSVQLTLIGSGTAALRSLAIELGSASSVELRGRLPAPGTPLDPLHPLHPELIHELQRADIFCSPSLIEGFPLVNAEALAAGLPLVLTDVSGSREVVHSKGNGILVPPGDPHALEEALGELVTNPERRLRYGVRSADLAYRYDWSRIAAEHLELYAQVGGER
jgi:glycosyltransferase involved in cell wall biosynthesis